MMKFGSLFSGIGGLDLGLERAGMECVWQVENNPYANRVLAKHWPKVRRHQDVRTFPSGQWDNWRCDLIAGGFPCVDISQLGSRSGIIAGADGSGLWHEFRRIICLIRPRIILLENVPDITFRGLSRVLGDLAYIGYDAVWQHLPAAIFGAPHIRNRFFAVGIDRYTDGIYDHQIGILHDEDPNTTRDNVLEWRKNESRMDRVADGVPYRLDRLRGLGNAVVPQVAEWLGRRILEFDRQIRLDTPAGMGQDLR